LVSGELFIIEIKRFKLNKLILEQNVALMCLKLIVISDIFLTFMESDFISIQK
jgi:hypothetical protein